MIKEAYCSEEVSILLKKKGFDECIFEFYEGDKIKYARNGKGFRLSELDSNIYYPHVTHQMAMAWLREEKNIFIVIEPHAYDYVNEKNKSYVCSLWVGDNYYENPELKSYPSYEEAVEAALKYVLEKIIK